MRDLFLNKTKLEAKAVFKQYAKLYHPDMGGNEDDFKALNKAYHDFLDDQIYEQELDKGLEKIISEILHLDIDISVVGSFIWVGGNTYEAKDKLKSMGFKWAKVKKMWFFGSLSKKNNGEKTFSQITKKYGQNKIKTRKAIA